MVAQSICDVYSSNFNCLKALGLLHVTISPCGWKTTMKDYIYFVLSVLVYIFISYINIERNDSIYEVQNSKIIGAGFSLVQNMNYVINLVIVVINFCNRNRFAMILMNLQSVDEKVKTGPSTLLLFTKRLTFVIYFSSSNLGSRSITRKNFLCLNFLFCKELC